MTTDSGRPPEGPQDRWRDGGLLLFLAVATAANYFTWRGYVFEDAFITYRYAANLAAGEGFVFQAGERVLGTSTPLYTLLLAAFGFLGADIPATGRLLFSCSLTACALFGWRLLARSGAPNAGVVFAVAAASGAGGILPFFGMETALHLALVFLAFLLADGRRPLVLGVVLGLLCMSRYDGVMAAAAILVFRFAADRRPPWRESLACGAIFGGWLLFAWVYFGSFLPNSYAAKAADVPFSSYLLAALEQQAGMLFLPLHWMAPGTLRPAFLVPALIVLFAPLAWRTFRFLAALPGRPSQNLGPPALFAILLWLGYSQIGPPLGHTWYLIPASYSLLALALAAWARLPIPAPAARDAAILFLLAGALLLPYSHRVQAATISTPAFGSARVDAYEDFAGWVRRHDFENTSVLTLEPGYHTYLSGQRAIDAAGLVSPGIFFHGPQERRQDFFALLDRFRPDMATTYSPLGREPAAEGNYLPALTPSPGFHLWMRRDFYAAHLEKLYQAWQAGEYGAAGADSAAAAWRHPIEVDFLDLGARAFFSLRRSRLQKTSGLTLAGEPYRQRVLNSRGAAREAAAWSEPFLIDFDQLEFLFAGSHGPATVAQLYVDGLLASEVPGRSAAEGPEAALPLEKVELPVHGWRGHRGRLFFVTTDAGRYFFAADQIRSRRFARQRLFDDFEKGLYDPQVWAETFAAAPLDNRKLAAIGGLPMAQGRFAAASLFEAGPRRMRSRPFPIDHQRMSFAFFDFGDRETGAELVVGGRAVHRHSGQGGARISLVQWDLSPWQGEMAVLELRDDAAAAEVGIGIDSILLYDP